MTPHRFQAAGLALLLTAAVLLSACADQQRIWFENQLSEPISVSVDGDRLLIIWPNTGQFLPYSTAAWSWPRRIDIREHPGGRVLMSETLDADGLARAHWTFYIRP